MKGSYLHHKEVKAAQGIKIAAQGLESAVAGTQMLVVQPNDNLDLLKEEVMADMQDIFSSVDRGGAHRKLSTTDMLTNIIILTVHQPLGGIIQRLQSPRPCRTQSIIQCLSQFRGHLYDHLTLHALGLFRFHACAVMHADGVPFGLRRVDGMCPIHVDAPSMVQHRRSLHSLRRVACRRGSLCASIHPGVPGSPAGVPQIASGEDSGVRHQHWASG